MQKMIEFGKVAGIKYEFFNGQISNNLINGLREYGPIDLETRNFKDVDISLLCPEGAKRKLEGFLESLENSLKTYFRIRNVYKKIITYENKTFDEKIVDDELAQISNERDTRKIVLHYHDLFVDKYNAPYYKIKRELLAKGISTQGLLREHYPERDSRRKGAYINNIACGIYAKVGGRPWGILGAISEILKEDTIYIGFDVSRKIYDKAVHTGPGCVVVYDEKGQYVYHFTENFPINHDTMEHDVAKNLMEMTLARVQQKKKRSPKNIVFMRDGDIAYSEVQGFQDALIGKNLNLHIIDVRKRGNIPILLKSDENFNLADSGTYLKIRSGNQRKPFDLFVQNLGNDIFLTTMPKALKITPWIIKELQINIEEYMKDVIRQIFVLSNLNWSYLRGRVNLPIIVHYAHEAANLIRIGINPKNIDAMALWML